MKTTPLPEILKQITPLPYGAQLKTIYESAEPFREIASADYSEAINPAASIAYLTHAANVLPGLVEALGRAGDIARGDLLDGLHGESVSKDDFDAQLRNVRGIAMSLEAILSKALSLATNVPVNS